MEPVDLFYSYAHEDEPLRDELDGHLALLRRKGVIRPWHDRGIVPGQQWDEAIDRELSTADLILLLVSMDFLNSDYIWGKELATAIERARRGDASVIPVLLVTQDERLAREMDAIWFMHSGRVVAAGPPAAVLDGEGAGAGFFAQREAA